MYITKEEYELLTEGYKDWYDQLSKREKTQKKAILSSFEYFKKKPNLAFNEKTASPLKGPNTPSKGNQNDDDSEKALEMDESFIQYLSQQKPARPDPEADENYFSEGSEEEPDYASRRGEELEENIEFGYIPV